MYEPRDSDLAFPPVDYPMFVLDRTTLRILVANDVAIRTYGYSRRQLRSMTIGDLRPSDERSGGAYVPGRRIDARTSASGPLKHITARGRLMHVELLSMEAEHRNRPIVVVLTVDVTERVRDEERRRDALLETVSPSRIAASELHLEKAQKVAQIGSWSYDFGTQTLACSQQLYETLGISPDTALAPYPLRAYTHPEDADRVESALRRARTGDGKYAVEHRIVRPDGTTRRVDVRADYEFDAAHAPMRVTGTILDITQRREAAYENDRAQSDGLSGLPTRETIVAMTKLAIFDARSAGEKLAVFFVNCGGVSEVNEAFGHAFGDKLVEQIAARISSAVEENGSAGRWGGQEFLVIAPCDAKEGHHATLRALQSALERPFIHEGHGLHAFPTIGISIYPEHGETAEELIRNADATMSVAKARHLSSEIFSWPMHENVRERIEIHGALRQAIERGEFVLAYQPIVDARTDEGIAVEALLRWRHPERGLVYPDAFIEIAETSDMIIPLGRWVLREACRAARAWSAQGVDLCAAVNVSPRQFRNDDLVQSVREALESSGLDADRLELELTESSIMDDVECAARIMTELRSLGVRLSLDDFGTGYSSLARLKRFPLDSLKVDRAFIHDMLQSDFDTALVTAIVQLGRSRRLHVIGEGVETEEQVRTLRRLGCTQLQGYFVARPLWGDDIPDFFAHRPRRSREATHEEL